MKKILFVIFIFVLLPLYVQAQFRFKTSQNEIWEVKTPPTFKDKTGETYCVFEANILTTYSISSKNGVRNFCTRNIFDLTKNVLGSSAIVRHKKKEVFVTLATDNSVTISLNSEAKKTAIDNDFAELGKIMGNDQHYNMPTKYYKKVFSKQLYIHLPQEQQAEMKEKVAYKNLGTTKINFDK